MNESSAVLVMVVVLAALIGFWVGRRSNRTRGSATAGRPDVSSKRDQSGLGEAYGLALSRIGSYLRHNVDGPLSAAFENRSLSLRKAAEQAVAAVDDLRFFLQDPTGGMAQEDLVKVAAEAVREFEANWDVSVQVSEEGPARVRANAESLLDAVYLLLHNAAAFGQGKRVVVTVSSGGGWGRLLVRDDGPGFTAEALSRACDPFYTTSEGGLGLGLWHARRAVELQAGRLYLRNRMAGGAEVEISLPLA